MSPRDEREHSASGKHCSVVRLKAESSSQAGWPNCCCSGLRVICNRDRGDLNYSFFGLELCPYQLELGSFRKKEGARSPQEQSSIRPEPRPFPSLDWPNPRKSHCPYREQSPHPWP